MVETIYCSFIVFYCLAWDLTMGGGRTSAISLLLLEVEVNSSFVIVHKLLQYHNSQYVWPHID